MSFKLLDFIMLFHCLPSYLSWFLYSMSSGVTMDDVKRTEEMFQFLQNELHSGKKDEDFDGKDYDHIRCAKYHIS